MQDFSNQGANCEKRESCSKILSMKEAFRPIWSLFGHLGNERGQLTEKRVRVVFCNQIGQPACPPWLLGYEKASARDDRERKIDAWVDTDVGRIPLQIKSSEKGAQKARKELKPEIVIVVVRYYEEPEEIFRQVLAAVAEKRNQYLVERGEL